MPLLETSGNSTADAYGGGAAAIPNYIEDVFSTYLYTGNGTSQTITNGIDLSGKGGMVWIKGRSVVSNNLLTDTNRGAANQLISDGDYAQMAFNVFSGFNSNGFGVTSAGGNGTNNAGATFASWTFRKQPKFFDVVTFTGGPASNPVTVNHNLGSTPGCIIIKCTSATGNWFVGHRATTNPFADNLYLNLTNAQSTNYGSIGNVTSTSFQFYTEGTVGTSYTWVAYLFAHNAGGFGLTGTDNVISCGSFTTDGSANASVTLGYEPQWVLMKPTTTSASGNWIIADNMRGWTVDGAGKNANQQLYANLSDAEAGGTPANLTSTGFNFTSSYAPWASQTWIYIAIRRGPMKVPTDGTKVFTTNAYTGTGAARTITTGFATDLVIGQRLDGESSRRVVDRLRGDTAYLATNATSAEVYSDGVSQDLTGFDVQTGYTLGVPNNSWMNNSGSSCANWAFQRAPGFFDEVCYTGNGSAVQAINHNLQAYPEIVFCKKRSATGNWTAYIEANGTGNFLLLNSSSAAGLANTTNGVVYSWSATQIYASSYNSGGISDVNASGATYVAYLFASCPGVSKVGSYTGTGGTQTISCGFTGGARFVLIKRTDSTGDWWVWDSARGMVAGTDPRLALDTTAAEVNANWIYTTTGGFQIVGTDASINANGGSYIYLAVA